MALSEGLDGIADSISMRAIGNDGRDTLTSATRARGLAERARSASAEPVVCVELPGAGHSFFSRHSFGPFGPLIRVAGVGYDASASEDAWERILRFFDTHLRRSPP